VVVGWLVLDHLQECCRSCTCKQDLHVEPTGQCIPKTCCRLPFSSCSWQGYTGCKCPTHRDE
jgi:hypothetical protein